MNIHVWYKRWQSKGINVQDFISPSIRPRKVEYNQKTHVHDEYLFGSICNVEVENKVDLELKCAASQYGLMRVRKDQASSNG